MKKLVIAVICVLAATFVFAEEHGKSCGMKDKKADATPAKACDMKGKQEAKAVELTGKVLCKHCDLKQSDSCEKVFQPSNDEKTLYKICDSSKVDVEKLGEDKGVYKVKGTLSKCAKDGQTELMITEATKVETTNT